MKNKSLQSASDSKNNITSRIRTCDNRQQLEHIHSLVCRRYNASERDALIYHINQRYAELMKECYWNEL